MNKGLELFETVKRYILDPVANIYPSELTAIGGFLVPFLFQERVLGVYKGGAASLFRLLHTRNCQLVGGELVRA